MAETTVVAPDGKEITVVHPPGASQDEIIAYAKANYQVKEPAPKGPDVGHLEGLAAQTTQGASLGWADELGGLAATAASYLDPRAEADVFDGMSFGDRYEALRDTARGRMGSYEEANPKKALAAQVAGGLMTGGAGGSSLAGLKGAQLVGGSGLLGAGYGGLSGAGHSEADTVGGVAGDAALGAAVGGVTGAAFPAAGQALSKAKTAARQAFSPSRNYQKAVNVLQDADVPLTTGQIQGSNWQKVVEDQLGDTPLIGTRLQRVKEAQRTDFQKGLLNQLGAKADDGFIDLNKANQVLDDISKQYGRALRGKFVNLADDAFLDDLARIEAKHTQIIDDASERKIRSIVTKFLNKATEGKQTGEWYQNQRSLFAKRAQGSSDTAGMYGDLVEALDSAFERVAPKVKGDIDKRWAQAKQLQRIAQSGGAEVSEGILPLASLNRAAKTNPGTKAWKDYINSGAAVLPPRVGNSGTASRQMANDFIRGGIMAGAGFTNPYTAIPGMLLARGAANRMARGGRLDVTNLLPGGTLLSDPRVAQGLAANAGLLQ